jgi:hypothetical protein
MASRIPFTASRKRNGTDRPAIGQTAFFTALGSDGIESRVGAVDENFLKKEDLREGNYEI